MNLVNCGISFVVGGMNFVDDELNCMNFGRNFVLRQTQVVKNFDMKNLEVRLDN